MRRVSTKRRALLQEVNPIRDDYRAMFPLCQWCRANGYIVRSKLHEFSSCAARSASLGVRAALLQLCADSHRLMDWLQVDAQPAIKRLVDPDGYDRRAVNVLRGRAPEAITEREVDRWV